MEDNKKIDKYREKLISRFLLTYDYYDKTDNELLDIAIERGNNAFQEFSIYRIGKIFHQDYQAPSAGKVVNSKYIQFESIVENSTNTYNINISSIQFPHQFPFDSDNQFDNLYCNINGYSAKQHKGLNYRLDELVGENVIVLGCWDGMDKFGNFKKVFNIHSLEDEFEAISAYKRVLTCSRAHGIEEILKNPITYLTKYDLTFFNIAEYSKSKFIEPIAKTLESQLELIDNYKNDNPRIFNPEIYYSDNGPSHQELWEDSMDALTDGNWRDDE
jgi:hypothetical protein